MKPSGAAVPAELVQLLVRAGCSRVQAAPEETQRRPPSLSGCLLRPHTARRSSWPADSVCKGHSGSSVSWGPGPAQVSGAFTYSCSTGSWKSAASGGSSVGGSHMCSARLHRRTCMSQERRLYFLYLLGVEGWSFGSLRCLREGESNRAPILTI